MKKSISLVLCLAMLISVFSCLGVTASAADAKDLFTVSSSLKNDKLTYTVYLNKNVALSGAIIYAKFDPKVLTPVIDEDTHGAYMVSDGDGGMKENVAGMYETGLMAGYSDRVSVAHAYGMDTDYKSGSSNKAYMTFTFKVTDKNRPKTTVNFYCYEFNSKSAPENNIANGSSALICSKTNSTLGPVEGVTVYNEQKGIKVSWNATTGADKYIVLRKTTGEFAEIYRTANSSVTSYVDTSVSNTETYTYTVRSLNEDGYNTSSNATQLTIKRIVAPSTLTLKNNDGSIVATWSKVTGATSYKLFRRTVDSNGTKSDWVAVSSRSSALTYTDKSVTKGKTYEYAVRSYTEGSNKELYYNGLYGAKQIVCMKNPSVSVEATVTGVKISWSKVSGATGYRVYRKVKGGSWVTVKNASASETSYTDTSAPSGKYLYYTVRGINGSSASAYDTQGINYLKTPTVSVKNTASGVKVSWNKVSGATSYYVYRKAGNATSWSKIATTSGSSYTDKNVKSGTTYKYCIKAINSSVQSKAGSPAYETIKFLSAPTLSSVTSTKSGITVNWKAVTGASGYIVYRDDGSGSFKKLATVSGGKTVKYVDSTAQKGKTYSYRVVATSGSYKSSYKTTLTIKDKY
ncbi:MAG: hypothetical protein ACI4VW_05830 [Acutalibacteraceae bacterium]